MNLLRLEKNRSPRWVALCLSLAFLASCNSGDAPAEAEKVRLFPVGLGLAGTRVNSTIYRQHSITSDLNFQFIAYYDEEEVVVLGRRLLGASTWETQRTPYRGRTDDPHNVINIAIDGRGFLHMAWDSHRSRLRYCRSLEPGSMLMGEETAMIGNREDCLTYPEFVNLPDGDLLLFYRNGTSGNGDLVVNRYLTDEERWMRVQDPLIDGEGLRNPYWQWAVDRFGHIHLSWVWREDPPVESNHDLAYAKSLDGGVTWLRSDGTVYDLPIRAAHAEYAWLIPPGSDLINQTSMATDPEGRPYIAGYWREEGSEVPQFQIVHHDGGAWRKTQVGQRVTPFRLGGLGSNRIPISRPQLAIDSIVSPPRAYMIFRDLDRGERVSMAVSEDIATEEWTFLDLNDFSVEAWEPTYDKNLWFREARFNIFVQRVAQVAGGEVSDLPPQMVYVLAWDPYD